MTTSTQTPDPSPNNPNAPAAVPTSMPAPEPKPPEPTPAPVVTAPEPAPPEPAPTAPREGEVLTIPRRAMAKLKKEERERGRKALADELQARAVAAGFESWEDMVAAGEAAKKQGKPVTKQNKQKPGKQPQAQAREDLTLEELRRLNKANALEAKRRKAAEQKVQAMEAEMALRASAIRNGVQDVDYALELLRRKIRGKSAAELAEFNEDQFFGADLKKSHPYLYTTTDAPAHTAPTSTEPAPKPAPTTPPTPASGAIDARKLTPEEYNALLKKHGIKNPTLGL